MQTKLTQSICLNGAYLPARSSEVGAWIYDYVPQFSVECNYTSKLYFNLPPLKSRNGWGITFYRLICVWLIDQSHRYGRHQAACREPAGSYDKTTRTAICFEHKTQYLLIRAPYARIVIFWHISNIPPMISQSQISCNTPTFYIAAIFVKYYYTTGSWLL